MKLPIFWAVAMMALVALAAPAADAFQNGTWQDSTSATALPNTPANLSTHGAGALNGRVYMFGGFVAGFQSTTYEYEPVANAWTTLSAQPLPAGLYGMGSATLNGRIYCIGGSPSGEIPVRLVRVFDPSTGWTTLTSSASAMPTARMGLTCVAQGDRIYAIGGRVRYNGAAVTAVEEFNPATGTWRGAADGIPQLPEARSFVATGAPGGQIVVAGGYPSLSNTPSSVVYGWTPASGASSWSVLESMSEGRGGAYGASFGGRFFCIGGNGPAGATRTVLQFIPQDAAGYRWTSLATAAFPYAHGAGAMLNTKFHIVGMGGPSSWVGNRELQAYQPPGIGNSPALPTGFAMQDDDANPVAPGDWMGGPAVTFSANITDSDLLNGTPDRVALQVEVIPVGDTFAQVNGAGAMGAQGLRSVTFGTLATGDYKVRYRAIDEYGNVTAWVDAPTDPAFRSDLDAPPVPAVQSPGENEDAQVGADVGPVTFRCAAVTDNNGRPVTYEFQVFDADGNLVDEAVSTVPEAVIGLRTSHRQYSWMVSARDSVGNVSAHSAEFHFRVVHDDGINHSEGDAAKVCGMSVPAGTTAAPMLLILLVMLAARRRI